MHRAKLSSRIAYLLELLEPAAHFDQYIANENILPGHVCVMPLLSLAFFSFDFHSFEDFGRTERCPAGEIAQVLPVALGQIIIRLFPKIRRNVILLFGC